MKDRNVPNESGPWEYITTIGLGWGINREHRNKDFKSGEQLYQIYQEVRKKENYHFLINLGPTSSGEFIPEEVNSLIDFSQRRK